RTINIGRLKLMTSGNSLLQQLAIHLANRAVGVRIRRTAENAREHDFQGWIVRCLDCMQIGHTNLRMIKEKIAELQKLSPVGKFSRVLRKPRVWLLFGLLPLYPVS